MADFEKKKDKTKPLTLTKALSRIIHCVLK